MEPGAHAANTARVVRVVVVSDEKVLLVRRGPTSPWRPGWWELPGGIVDEGETFAEAGIREVFEEVNLPVDLDEPVLERGMLSSDTPGQYWHLTMFSAASRSGEVVLSHEHDDWRWHVPGESLPQPLVDSARRGIARIDRVLALHAGSTR